MTASISRLDTARQRTAPLRMYDCDTERHPEKRVRILHHATYAFLAHGYEHANLTDIAIAAGVGKVTIYRYFDDKADLLRHVMIEASRQMAIPLTSILRHDGSMEEMLVRFACCYVNRMLDPIGGSFHFFEISRLMLSTVQTHPDVGRSCRDIFRASIHEPVVRYLQAMIDRGEIIEERPDFLAEHFIQMLFLGVLVLVEPARVPPRCEIEATASRNVRLFLRGCGKG